jgi:prophage regulatory protein
MSARILSLAELKSMKGLRWSDSHLGRLEKDGLFPRRVQIGANTVGWVEAEIDKYIESKVAARDAAA